MRRGAVKACEPSCAAGRRTSVHPRAGMASRAHTERGSADVSRKSDRRQRSRCRPCYPQLFVAGHGLRRRVARRPRVDLRLDQPAKDDDDPEPDRGQRNRAAAGCAHSRGSTAATADGQREATRSGNHTPGTADPHDRATVCGAHTRCTAADFRADAGRASAPTAAATATTAATALASVARVATVAMARPARPAARRR
jgi:hypothetical protein